MEGREWGEDGGVRHEESSFCGKKNLLSLRMALGEVDKYSDSNGAMTKMMDESRLTELYQAG